MKNYKSLLAIFILSSATAILATAYPESTQATYFLTALSTVCTVFTAVIAAVLYDKFDTNKLGFSKQSEATEKLAFEFCSKKFTFCKANMNELDAYQLPGAMPLFNFTFYLNTHNLENDAFGEENLPVYFSQTYLDFAKLLSIHSLNPWLPAPIRKAIQPLLIFNTSQILMDNMEQVFLLVTSYNKIPDSSENFYVLRSGDNRIKDVADLHENLSNMLASIQTWYGVHFDETPDFSGH